MSAQRVLEAAAELAREMRRPEGQHSPEKVKKANINLSREIAVTGEKALRAAIAKLRTEI